MGTPAPALSTQHNPARRIIQLDALRGAAVIGIIWMNVYVFALPSQTYYNPAVWPIGAQGPDMADRLVWAVSFVFIEDKFRTLFAMLFGVGCLILLERSGPRKWRAHYARMAVLFAIGLVHSILLASNDVLRVYAMAGLALPLIANMPARDLYRIAVGLLVVHLGAGMVLLGPAISDLFEQRISSSAYLAAERNFGADPAALRYSFDLGTEGLGERIARRGAGIMAQLQVLSGAIPLNLAAMALGMALWKDGMLVGEWRVFRLQRLAALCAVVAIPALLALAYWTASFGYPGALVGASSLILSAPFDMVLGLAYAALAMAFFAPGGAATEKLAAVGRLSLTNYVMTSLILAAIFASWGLGLFGTMARGQVFAISFVPIIAMLLWSPLWLARFGQGPLERLWRRAARVLS